MVTKQVYTPTNTPSSISHSSAEQAQAEQAAEFVRKQWRQAVGILAKRGAGFVLIDRGSKGTGLRKGWNKNPASKAAALAHLDAGGNVGLLTGTGEPVHLYAFDMDADAMRGYECDQIGGTLTFARENAPGRAKFIFACDDTLPARNDKTSHTELLGIASTGGYGNCVIAGVHKSGAPILWAGHTIAQLDRETVAALWHEWTGKELFPTYTHSERTEAAPELATIADALDHIDAQAIDYTAWISVLAALKHDYGDAALDLAIAWGDGLPGEVAAKWGTFGDHPNPTTGRTIYKLAIDAGWTPPNGGDLIQLHQDILHAQAWLGTPDAAQALKDAGLRYTTGRKILDTLYELCAQWNSASIRPGLRLLALRAGCGVAAVQRALPRLQAAGLLTITLPDADVKYTTAATITVAFQNDHSSFPQGANTVIVSKSYAEHRCDDAFRNNHAAYRKRVPDGLPPLGETALPVMAALLDGPGSAGEIAARLGIGAQPVRRALKRGYAYGLITATIEAHGRRQYALSDTWTDDLPVLRRHMTSYGVQLRREVQCAESRLQTALISGEPVRIERARAGYNRLAAAAGWGGDAPAQWVGGRRGRKWLRWDTAERAADHAQVTAAVLAMRRDGAPAADIRRQLGFAGYAAADVSKALAGGG